MTYDIRENADGTCSVVLVPDDDGSEALQGVNTGDNHRSWSDAKTSSILRNMNKANRAYHTRDSVASATKSTTVFTQHLNPDERLEIRKNADMWELVLVSPTTDLIGTIPPGAQKLNEGDSDDDFPDTGEVSSAGQGERSMPRGAGGKVADRAAPMTNKRLNEIHRQYWQRRA